MSYEWACGKGIGMDLLAFEAWLGGITALTAPQRRRAWQVLALREATDNLGIETRGSLEQGASRF